MSIFVDSKVLESLMIVVESKSDELLNLSEDKYNKYFLTIKTDCVRIIKDMMKSIDIPKAKYVVGTHKIGQFNTNFVGYNDIYIGHFQYVTSNEIKPLIDEFLAVVNKKYSDLVSEKLMYFKVENGISLYLSFRKYNSINDDLVPKLKIEISACINAINKDLKTPLYLSAKKSAYNLILTRLNHMLTTLDELDAATIVRLQSDIAAINSVSNILINNKIKTQINNIESLVNQLQ